MLAARYFIDMIGSLLTRRVGAGRRASGKGFLANRQNPGPTPRRTRRNARVAGMATSGETDRFVAGGSKEGHHPDCPYRAPVPRPGPAEDPGEGRDHALAGLSVVHGIRGRDARILGLPHGMRPIRRHMASPVRFCQHSFSPVRFARPAVSVRSVKLTAPPAPGRAPFVDRL